LAKSVPASSTIKKQLIIVRTQFCLENGETSDESAINTKTPSPMSYTLATVPVMYGEEGLDITTRRETLPPPTLPSPAFHFNKKVPMRSLSTSAEEDVHARLQQVEAQIVKKQGKTDRRSASLQALLKERVELQARVEAQMS